MIHWFNEMLPLTRGSFFLSFGCGLVGRLTLCLCRQQRGSRNKNFSSWTRQQKKEQN